VTVANTMGEILGMSVLVVEFSLGPRAVAMRNA
jgi:hypothetical protein